jgi:hypothetical protein
MAKEKLDWLKLRISYYPNPKQRKMIVATSHLKGTSLTETVELICRKHFASVGENECNFLTKYYNEDLEGKIKAKEKTKYIK